MVYRLVVGGFRGVHEPDDDAARTGQSIGAALRRRIVESPDEQLCFDAGRGGGSSVVLTFLLILSCSVHLIVKVKRAARQEHAFL
jgi:hypothetical protein